MHIFALLTKLKQICDHPGLADRMLPDKAIDLMDEAASRLRMEIDSVPSEVDDLQRQRNQLEMERLALEKETERRISSYNVCYTKLLRFMSIILLTETCSPAVTR